KVWDVDSPEVVCDPPGDDFFCTVTAGLPANREIHVSEYSGCMVADFAAPVTWVNTQTGEKKVLYDHPTSGPDDYLEISTTDNFLLIEGWEPVVADLNTGEVVLRIGPRSTAIGGAACP